MAAFFTDEDIERLLREPKPLAPDFDRRLKMKPKRGHKGAEMTVSGAAGSEFRVILRQADRNPLDFSVILGVVVPGTYEVFRLRRYNGKSHEHTNRMEGNSFYDFHMHCATERYQAAGPREDAYAQPTDRYSNLDGAVECLLADCGFERPAEPQQRLFGE